MTFLNTELFFFFLRSDRNNELDQQREQYGNLKWKLERRLKELDGELGLQRQVGWGIRFFLRTVVFLVL